MDPTSYWMWRRRQWNGGAPLNFLPSMATAGYSYNESWEERAFAEDTAGLLGAGCVWPPRSYSCSFCGREFRSAQALGGHMNVHRRDRARLKHTSSPDRENNDYQLHPNPQSTISVHPNPNPNPNPNPSSDHVASNLSSPSKNSAVSTHDNCSENTLLSASCSSNVIQERLKEPLFSTLGSRTEPTLIQELDDLDLKLGGMTRKAMEACSQESENRGGDGDDEANRCKRRRLTSMLLPSKIIPTCSRNKQEVQSELLQRVGEVDLELRLGYGPKI